MTQITDSDREAAEAIVAANIEKWGWGPLDEIEDLSEHKLAVDACAAGIAAMSAEIERLKGMAGKICDGCGSVEHIDTLRAKPGVISCCPERKLVDAKDLWLEIDQLRREKAEAVELLKNLLPSFTGGIDPIEAEPVVKARAFLGQQEQRT